MKKLVLTDSGKLSSTKVWANVGCAIASYIVLKLTNNDKMTWEIFLAYLGTVGGFSQVSKWLSYRYGANTNADITAKPVEVSAKCQDCPTTKSAVDVAGD